MYSEPNRQPNNYFLFCKQHFRANQNEPLVATTTIMAFFSILYIDRYRQGTKFPFVSIEMVETFPFPKRPKRNISGIMKHYYDDQNTPKNRKNAPKHNTIYLNNKLY